jgi:ribosomal subunit interface protein
MMEISITVRHTTVPRSLKEKARELIEKLANRAHRPHHAAVVFDSDHGRSVVELKLLMPKSQVVVASAEADDFKSALDRVIEKAGNQLDKTPSPARR